VEPESDIGWAGSASASCTIRVKVGAGARSDPIDSVADSAHESLATRLTRDDPDFTVFLGDFPHPGDRSDRRSDSGTKFALERVLPQELGSGDANSPRPSTGDFDLQCAYASQIVVISAPIPLLKAVHEVVGHTNDSGRFHDSMLRPPRSVARALIRQLRVPERRSALSPNTGPHAGRSPGLLSPIVGDAERERHDAGTSYPKAIVRWAMYSARQTRPGPDAHAASSAGTTP